MTTQMVEVKEMNLIGTIYDRNEKFIWIETNEDIFVVAAEKVTEIAATNENENEIEKFLNEKEISFDGYVDGENISYMIEGLTYTIDVYCDFEYNVFSLETVHRGFDREVDQWVNKKQYKKLSTLIKNIEKWANK